MDAFFKKLGDTVLARWKRENFSLAKFPAIAVKALDENPPAKQVDFAALMRDFLLNDDQPSQTGSDFGEPEIVAYSHPRFYIQLLFWLDGTTAIHQHEFSGAFHVMKGSSIHAHYTFEDAKSVTPYLKVGNLKTKKIDLLEAGRTVPIVSGSATIHSLFHLDSPSVTVVVRTQHDPGTGPQFNYLPPHLAVDPYHQDPLMTRRKQILDVMDRTDDERFRDHVHAMIVDLDFERGFSVLQHAMPALLEGGEWDDVMASFRKKHGTLAAGVEVTLTEELRRASIKGMRGSIEEPEHRFFLALLMNASTKKELLGLVKQRFPADRPEDVVIRWVQELAEMDALEVSILDAVFPESLALNSEDQLDPFLTAFAFFLRKEKKVPSNLRGLGSGFVDELREAFAGSSLGILTK